MRFNKIYFRFNYLEYGKIVNVFEGRFDGFPTQEDIALVYFDKENFCIPVDKPGSELYSNEFGCHPVAEDEKEFWDQFDRLKEVYQASKAKEALRAFDPMI